MNEPLKSSFASVQESFIINRSWDELHTDFKKFEGDSFIIGAYNRIIVQAQFNEGQIIDIKNKMNDEFFQEENLESLENSLRNMALGWLPKITEFKNETHEDALRNNLEILQHFAVGIEVICSDAVRDANVLEPYFQSIFKYLIQLMENFKIIMEYAGVKGKPDVTSEVMPIEDRERQGTELIFRDFVIMRDYGKAVQYISELYEHLKLALLSGKSYHAFSETKINPTY